MKELLERHAEPLAPEERRAIWEAISDARAKQRGAQRRWAAPALASVVAATAVFVFLLVPRVPQAPNAPQPAGRVHTAEPTARAEVAAPAPSNEAPVAIGRPAASVRSRAERAATAPTPIVAVVPAPAPAASGLGVVTGKVTERGGQPVAFANVLVMGTHLGAMTDENGVYVISRVPADTQTVKVMAIGFEPVLATVAVESDRVAAADLSLGASRAVTTVSEVEVRAEKRIDTKSSATKQTITADRLRQIPVDNLGQAVGGQAGTVPQGGTLHFRGGRSGEVKHQVNGAPPAISVPPAISAPATPAPPPVIPTTGGTRLPNDEAFDSMFFKSYGVNPFIAADEDALSTFAVDVDAASYTVTRRYLGLGHLPPADAVRVEEFVNFFPQGYPKFENEDFRILVDGAPSPFGAGYQLLRIGIKGREVTAANRKSAQLTFVIDVSGSMNREDRLELVKRALHLLVDRLRGDDRVGIVVYGSQGRVLLEPVALTGRGDGRRRILAAIDQLQPEGSTNAEQGLQLGYEMARRHYRAGALNRIVLCSDGVANVGRTGPQTILAQVRSEADRGIHLTTIGFGMGNYNDVLMEQLADKGDGNHYYVDEIGEAQRVLVENLTGTLQTIARDAKVQVEFDSTRVLRYRLIGFENRDVADRDFRNDKVDAGEIGAGHEVTALYEVKLAPRATQGTLATVRFRWARPEQDGGGQPQVREIVQRFDAASLSRRFEDAAPRLRLDAAVAEFAEILRGSYWAREGRLADVLAVARSAAAGLRDEAATEFVTLVEKAAALSGPAKPGAGVEQR